MKIILLADETAPWDRYVRAHPNATFFHLAAWRAIIERAFHHRTHYLIAEQDGSIAGVLPLAQVKTRLFGHTLVSLPFCVYGGPLADTPEIAAALATKAAALGEQLGASATELRLLHDPGQSLPEEQWHRRQALYATFRLAMTGNDDANMKAIPRKQRAMVRKGIERQLSAQSNRDVNTLHRVYAESVRNLGTPVFSRRYFRILAEVFGNELDVVTVRSDEAPVAAVMNFYWRDEVLPYYGGGTARARALAANDFMYWSVMRFAAARGCRMFDFGRSKEGTGSYAFKKNWGFAPTQLAYLFHLAPGSAIPENNPMNPKYRLLIAAWKRLPLPVANALGPLLVRGVG